MENEPNAFGDLFESVNDYVDTRIDLLRLKTIDKSSDIISSLTVGLVILLTATFGIILLNIGLAIWLGRLMGHIGYGFFAVGGFYTVLAIVLFGFKRKWLKGPFNDMMVKKMLN